jgi:hypothetical protein
MIRETLQEIPQLRNDAFDSGKSWSVSPHEGLRSLLKNPLSPRLLKKVQMQGGTRRAE